MIDTIDTHVESTTTYVEDASREVSKAIDYRKSSRKKWRWCCLLTFILLIVVAIVVYVTYIKPLVEQKDKPK